MRLILDFLWYIHLITWESTRIVVPWMVARWHAQSRHMSLYRTCIHGCLDTYVVVGGHGQWRCVQRPSTRSHLLRSGVGVTKPIYSVPLFSHFFHINQNNGYLHDITFIFDRCHCSWAAETPDKYEFDQKSLTYTFAKSKRRNQRTEL